MRQPVLKRNRAHACIRRHKETSGGTGLWPQTSFKGYYRAGRAVQTPRVCQIVASWRSLDLAQQEACSLHKWQAPLMAVKSH